MKEKTYNLNILNSSWGFRNLISIPIFVILNLVIRHFFTENMFVPGWMDNFIPIFTACFNGPYYGTIIAVLYNVVVYIMNPGNLLARVVFTALMVAVVLLFGAMVRLGFFSNSRGICMTIFIVSFVEAALLTPSNFAFFGGTYSASYAQLWLRETMTAMGILSPWKEFLGYFIIAVFDNVVMTLLLRLIMSVIPEKLADSWKLLKAFPTVSIVENANDEAFVAESDRLKEKAQEKLNKQKEEELKNAGNPTEPVEKKETPAGEKKEEKRS